MAEKKLVKSSPVVGALLRAAFSACSRLPLRVTRAFGGGLGRLAGAVPNDLRKTTRMNLAWCFPEWTAEQRRRVARRSLVATGRTVAETAALLPRPPAALRRLEEGVEGEELLTEALAGGRGVLILLPHLGNWEMLNPLLMARSPFAALYRPPRHAELSRLVVAARERTGCTMIPATSSRGLRQVYRELAAGKPLVLLPDQEPVRRSGVFAPFFGIPALTMTLPARLLRRLSVPVLFAYALRTASGGFHYHLRPPPEGLDDPDPAVAAERLNLGVERCVRACPEQYVWSYKRFKTRPPEEERRLRVEGSTEGVRLYDRRRGLPPRPSPAGPSGPASRGR
ncbi:MAG: lysophospholipid acyltransferase family protein [Thermoanaerobaculia bacterium]|nr:lysophospholipid acyltransferase family protein [Thermoanaerobaculia bacterium]